MRMTAFQYTSMMNVINSIEFQAFVPHVIKESKKQLKDLTALLGEAIKCIHSEPPAPEQLVLEPVIAKPSESIACDPAHEGTTLIDFLNQMDQMDKQEGQTRRTNKKKRKEKTKSQERKPP